MEEERETAAQIPSAILDERGHMLCCSYIWKTPEDWSTRLPPVLARCNNLCHKVGETQNEHTFLLWHGASVAGTVARSKTDVPLFSVWSLRGCLHGFNPKSHQARRIEGSKLASGMSLSQSICLCLLHQESRWGTLEPLSRLRTLFFSVSFLLETMVSIYRNSNVTLTCMDKTESNRLAIITAWAQRSPLSPDLNSSWFFQHTSWGCLACNNLPNKQILCAVQCKSKRVGANH